MFEKMSILYILEIVPQSVTYGDEKADKGEKGMFSIIQVHAKLTCVHSLSFLN